MGGTCSIGFSQHCKLKEESTDHVTLLTTHQCTELVILMFDPEAIVDDIPVMDPRVCSKSFSWKVDDPRKSQNQS